MDPHRSEDQSAPTPSVSGPQRFGEGAGTAKDHVVGEQRSLKPHALRSKCSVRRRCP